MFLKLKLQENVCTSLTEKSPSVSQSLDFVGNVLKEEGIWFVPQLDATKNPKSYNLPLGTNSAVEQTHL